MKKINYNLAGNRKIDVQAFAVVLALIFLAVLLFNGITIFNLARQQKQSHAEKKEISFITQKLAELNRKTAQQKNEIAVWKKAWSQKLVFSNSLIERKYFSFVFRLNFLEKVCSTGMRIRQLNIVNGPANRIKITVNALAQNELLGLYKKLLPYDLVIDNENQTVENYQANLSFKIKDEKK